MEDVWVHIRLHFVHDDGYTDSDDVTAVVKVESLLVQVELQSTRCIICSPTKPSAINPVALPSTFSYSASAKLRLRTRPSPDLPKSALRIELWKPAMDESSGEAIDEKEQ